MASAKGDSCPATTYSLAKTFSLGSWEWEMRHDKFVLFFLSYHVGLDCE